MIVDFPTLFGYIKQPSFGYQAIKERKKHFVPIGFIA